MEVITKLLSQIPFPNSRNDHTQSDEELGIYGLNEPSAHPNAHGELENVTVKDLQRNLRTIFEPESATYSFPGVRFEVSWAWYLVFLNAKISQLSTHQLGVLTVGEPRTLAKDLGRWLFFSLLIVVATNLREREACTLSDIIIDLEMKGLIGKSRTDAATSQITQLVFIALGWVSLLFDPVPTPGSRGLEIQTVAKDRGVLTSQSLFENSQQDFSLVEYPLYRLFCAFGPCIPSKDLPSQSNDPLDVRFLNYFTLKKVGGLEVEWVDALNLHLEFDEAMKTLKLFRFPSFCSLLCSTEYDPILNRLFAENAAHNRPDDEQGLTDVIDAGDFAREVLMSYRIIFGQDSKSWNAFKKLKVHVQKSTRIRLLDHDPLLDRLCGQDWRKEMTFYKSIQSFDAAYLPSRDLKYLGSKLLRLQNFCKAQNPQSWIILWHDRRNLLQFYTFWAFLFVGVGSILVGIAQILLAAIALRKQ